MQLMLQPTLAAMHFAGSTDSYTSVLVAEEPID